MVRPSHFFFAGIGDSEIHYCLCRSYSGSKSSHPLRGRAFASRVRERFLENYSRFGLALLPLTCAGLLAFHTHYFVSLFPQMLGLMSGYLGSSSAGNLTWSISPGVTLVIQQVLVGLGLAWTLITMYRLRGSSSRSKFRRQLGLVPHALVAVVLAALLIVVITAAFTV